MVVSPLKKEYSLIHLLKPYGKYVLLIIIFTFLSNGLNLILPKLLSNAIDDYSAGVGNTMYFAIEFFIISITIFLATYIQNIFQITTAERVARDLRERIIATISEQDYNSLQHLTSAKLLTNLTSDVDSVKSFVAQSIASILSSIFLILGASILLLSINWRLASAVLLIVPMIGVIFAFVFRKVRILFKSMQETIDWLNRIINESILGAGLIRLLNSQAIEYQKFLGANERAKAIGLSILRLFASLIPIISLVSNIAVLIILVLGGHFVISGSMTLGDLLAFNTYLSILIFPIIIIGFTSSVIAQASASYGRIAEILSLSARRNPGTINRPLTGAIQLEGISLRYGEKSILRDITTMIQPGTRTAIVGPTAAGKSQLLMIMTGLIDATGGRVLYDNTLLADYDRASFSTQIGIVFQESSLFNLTLRENIAFSNTADDGDIRLAIESSELNDLIDSLPEGLDTIVSERGTNLSGGQKQRIMLARALTLNPKILFLDDFTARLDITTEAKILENITNNYPNITLVSITQKIEPIRGYDLIILLMEGELLAQGTHDELMENSVEYVQIFTSQASTQTYEL